VVRTRACERGRNHASTSSENSRRQLARHQPSTDAPRAVPTAARTSSSGPTSHPQRVSRQLRQPNQRPGAAHCGPNAFRGANRAQAFDRRILPNLAERSRSLRGPVKACGVARSARALWVTVPLRGRGASRHRLAGGVVSGRGRLRIGCDSHANATRLHFASSLAPTSPSSRSRSTALDRARPSTTLDRRCRSHGRVRGVRPNHADGPTALTLQLVHVPNPQSVVQRLYITTNARFKG